MSRAENPPVAFIRELNKQVRVGLVPCGEGQSAIPGCADVAHGISLSTLSNKDLVPVGLPDSTFKRMQVDARARWLNTGEPHLGFALRTGRAPKCNRWNGERRALRLGHGELPAYGREHDRSFGHR